MAAAWSSIPNGLVWRGWSSIPNGLVWRRWPPSWGGVVAMKLRAEDLGSLARGAAVLGTGGGGDPHIGKLLAQQAVREHGPVEIVAVGDLPDDACVLPVAMMGAPTVMVEKLPSADQISVAVQTLAKYVGKTPTHLACIEVGGVNSTVPVIAAAQLGLPLVDGDG